MDELNLRHLKEQRDLQSKVTQKKKAASKKTRKSVNDECQRLEEELKEKQGQEISQLLRGDEEGTANDQDNGLEEDEHTINGDDVNDSTEALATLSMSDRTTLASQKVEIAEQERSRKPNRQKARLARRAAEQADVVAKAEEEAKSQPDQRAREREAMLAAFKARGFKEKEIRADGHCLYSAVADQLTEHEIGLRPRLTPTIAQEEAEPFRIVRKVTANYISTNADDFVPFLEEPLEDYVRKVGNTGEWGGQLELMALSKAYRIKISILDGNGSVHEIEGNPVDSTDDEKRIWLAYYRHGFGLGEHYNSLRKG